MRDDDQIGFSYTINKENKEDSTDKSGFVIGFKFPEGRLLKQYLINALNKSFKFYSNKNDQNDKQYTRHQTSPTNSTVTEPLQSAPTKAQKEEDDDSFDW